MKPKQIQLLVRVDLEVMSMKLNSTLFKAPELEPFYWMKFNLIHKIGKPIWQCV